MTEVREFWRTLTARQLVSGELPAGLDRPWYLRAFLAATLWLVAQFFLLAVVAIPAGMLFFLSSGQLHQGMAAFAVPLLLLAAWTSRTRGRFSVHQLGVAAALTGQGMLLSGLALMDLALPLPLLIAAVQLVVFLLVRDTLVRSLCVPAAVIALAYHLGGVLADQEQLLQLILPLLLALTGWLYLAEIRLARHHALVHPLKRGLTLALWLWLVLQQSGLLALGRGQLWAHSPLPLTLVVAGFLCWLLARQLQQPQDRLYALLLGVPVLAAGWFIPGVSVLTILLALAWMQGQRLYWLGHLIGLVVTLSFYYYNVEQTLLVKALVLLVLAMILLVLRFVLLRLQPAPLEES